uniref:Early protein E4 n=1 Tax=Human papillomavirus type 26 TaxID=333762 RepID=A0A219KX26_HPV26|nr:early protein E4 [Human papillomavirus type 26]AHY96051.1 early protein E4 [Human papillomavirus type 26]AHY96058.1 early protein E4 [Human papillomavirus type 26]
MYLVPAAATKYPLLKLLSQYQTPPPRPPKPTCPWAPRKPRRHTQESDDDSVDLTPPSPQSPLSPQLPHSPDSQWTIQTTTYTVQVEAITREGTRVVTKLCL